MKSLLILLSCFQGTFANPQIDSTIQKFMQQYNIPGMSVAVTYQGKMVYSKGYGFAVREDSTPVTTNSLFRIASVSKCITAAAILKLAEEGKLQLNDKIFGEHGLLGTRYLRNGYDSSILDITVDQLLHHTAGGWPNSAGNDPMALLPTLPIDSLIPHILASSTLKYKPGVMYMYSNFGYCLLGRVIASVSGMTYEGYIQEHLLHPVGINDMHIGSNSKVTRLPAEVAYYDNWPGLAYVTNVSRLEAAGGWITSAKDLAKFLLAIDGFDTAPDVLTAASITTMTKGSEANPGYGCGWLIDGAGNRGHAGSIPGTASEIWSSRNGVNVVLLCNSRNKDAFFNDLHGVVLTILNNKTLLSTGTSQP
ncbi:serine hydrolase [Chitinophaga sp. Cy-1792]|uniref:serine hydrolase domain-containing protein n=1 Tax=Chitinophaga sp. Cy-1792 TaxID=2608339 RepID=UPI00141DC5FA|nr:serine hydrolase domain-containing protein [Chitinophaga sp. Cy-1792]NIG52848.1 beta-lactamase family protein [Chitinophaga sp. Cy-1792]